MEALGGACGVRNRSDGQQGSLFWFRFPYRPQPDDQTAFRAAAEPLSPAVSYVFPTSLRVLVVDDTASILKTAKRFLSKDGHFVETAENGKESFERLKKDHLTIDLLITDLQMPVMVKKKRHPEALMYCKSLQSTTHTNFSASA